MHHMHTYIQRQLIIDRIDEFIHEKLPQLWLCRCERLLSTFKNECGSKMVPSFHQRNQIAALAGGCHATDANKHFNWKIQSLWVLFTSRKEKKPSNNSENVYTHLHTTNTLPLTINDKFVFSFAVISISGIFASRFRAPNGRFFGASTSGDRIYRKQRNKMNKYKKLLRN